MPTYLDLYQQMSTHSMGSGYAELSEQVFRAMPEDLQQAARALHRMGNAGKNGKAFKPKAGDCTFYPSPIYIGQAVQLSIHMPHVVEALVR